MDTSIMTAIAVGFILWKFKSTFQKTLCIVYHPKTLAYLLEIIGYDIEIYCKESSTFSVHIIISNIPWLKIIHELCITQYRIK